MHYTDESLKAAFKSEIESIDQEEMRMPITVTLTEAALKKIQQTRSALGLTPVVPNNPKEAPKNYKFQVNVDFAKLFQGQTALTGKVFDLAYKGLAYDSSLKNAAKAVFEKMENPSQEELDEAAQQGFENKGTRSFVPKLAPELLAEIKDLVPEIEDTEIKKIQAEIKGAEGFVNYQRAKAIKMAIGREAYNAWKETQGKGFAKAVRADIAAMSEDL